MTIAFRIQFVLQFRYYTRKLVGDWHLSTVESNIPVTAWRKGPVPGCWSIR